MGGLVAAGHTGLRNTVIACLQRTGQDTRPWENREDSSTSKSKFFFSTDNQGRMGVFRGDVQQTQGSAEQLGKVLWGQVCWSDRHIQACRIQ